MAWVADHWVAAVLFAVYTALLFYNANVGRRRSHDLTDYYVGGRAMGGVVVGISFFATFASTNSYIGHAGKGYEYGLPWLTFAAMILIFTLISWTSVAPRLRRFTLHWDAITLPDYLARRYGAENAALRVAAAVVILISSLLYLVAIFKGGGHLFQQFLGIPYEGAVGLTLVIVMLYTSIGGFVSVVRTDVIQGILMVIGSGTIFYFVTRAAGGVGVLGQLAERPGSEHVFTWSGGIPFAVLLGISLSGSLKLIVEPRQVSRFFALKDQRSVRVGTWVALGGLTVIMACLFPVGFYAHFLLDGVQDTDMIVPILVSDPNVFPPWVADFLIVAMMAAAMSSMDSVLLVSASVLYKDVVEVVHPAAHPLTWTRIGVIGLALLAAGVALRPPGGIVEITIFSGSLYAVCFFPAILFGLHWRGGSAQAVLASMVSGVLVLVGWLLAGGRDFVHEVFPAMLVSCLSYAWVANVTRPALEHWPTEG